MEPRTRRRPRQTSCAPLCRPRASTNGRANLAHALVGGPRLAPNVARGHQQHVPAYRCERGAPRRTCHAAQTAFGTLQAEWLLQHPVTCAHRAAAVSAWGADVTAWQRKPHAPAGCTTETRQHGVCRRFFVNGTGRQQTQTMPCPQKRTQLLPALPRARSTRWWKQLNWPAEAQCAAQAHTRRSCMLPAV